jgi:ribosome-binding factor A
MYDSAVTTIKRAQKERLFMREVASLLTRAAMDDSRLGAIFVTRVKLSADKGSCKIYCYTPEGMAAFEQVLELLKLYKPSLRAALSKTIAGRRTPELIFAYDQQNEKIERLHQLIDEGQPDKDQQ